VVEVSSAYACGWLNWGFYDQPEATDCSEFTGLATHDGKTKAWGKTFAELAAKLPSLVANTTTTTSLRPALDWDACLTSVAAAKDFRRRSLESFLMVQPAR
jgi:hypothetical protein